MVDFLVDPCIVDQHVALVVNQPAPAVVIHGAHADPSAIKHIDLGMQESLSCFVELDAFDEESLKEDFVFHLLENGLVSLAGSDDLGGEVVPGNGLFHLAFEFRHGVVVGLDNFDFRCG